jgi:hypothetical protein
MSNYSTNNWASVGGSGVQSMVNGRWVDSKSPEAMANQSKVKANIAAERAKVKKVEMGAFKSQIKGQTELDKSKAILEASDAARKTAEATAAQRVNAAAGAGTRGMSRRVHRRTGPSAFGALASLSKANLDESKNEISNYFDQSAQNKINAAESMRKVAEARTNMLRNTVIR